MLDPNRAFVIE